MKKLYILSILLIFFVGCAHKIDLVKVSPNLKIKSKKLHALVKRYEEYWDYFSKKDFDRAYLYELPHQRFIYTLQWYKKFNQPNNKGYTTILRNIKLINDYTADILSTYVSSDKKIKFNFNDKWYFIHGKWYHLMKTSRLISPVTQ